MLSAKVYYPNTLGVHVIEEMYSGFDGERLSGLDDEIAFLLSSLPPLTTLLAYYTVPCGVNKEGIVLNGNSAVLKHGSVPDNIVSCGYVTVYAATIEPNSLKQTELNRDIFGAYVYGSLDTYILEDMVNSLQSELEEKSGRRLSRVSPGYGNFNLESQKCILKLLEKRGLPITFDDETCKLKPLYSTTGVIGPLDRVF